MTRNPLRSPRLWLARTFVLLLAGLVLAVIPNLASAFETRARAAFVYDLTTGTVLLEKNADQALPPASMSKLMTVNMLFEALREGRISLTDRFTVSSKAKALGGSTMHLDERDTPTVEELIQGIIVLSGNDACVVVAENLAGSEAAFAKMMNERAPRIGLTNSHFVNASGWPAEGHVMSVRDLATLAARLITVFPEYYGYFSQTEFPFDGRSPANRFNRNPLLKLKIGADGLKTGHTAEAGYGLVGSAVDGDRRVIFVITGLASEQERAEEAEAVVNWAFKQFVSRTVAPAQKPVARAAVWLGTEDSVGLVPAHDVKLLLPAVQKDAVPGRVLFTGPLHAPVRAGQEVGTLVLQLAGLPERRVPLLADRDVSKAGVPARLIAAAQHLLGSYVGTDPVEVLPSPAAEPATAPAPAPAPEGVPLGLGTPVDPGAKPETMD